MDANEEIMPDYEKLSKQQLQRISYLADHAPDAAFWMDADGNFLYVNEEACRVLGYSRKELLTMGVADIDPSISDAVPVAMSETTKSLGTSRLETTHQHKDGRIFPVEVRVSYVEYEGKAYHCAYVRDITERKQADELIEHLAHFDSLTGLPNRVLFMDRLGQTLAQAHRNKTGFALFFLDLDEFKSVNDTLGHEAGDHTLKIVADRLRACVREVDTVARLGGDEFTIILPNDVQREQATVVAGKIIAALGEPIIIDGKEYQYHIGASIGIVIHPEDGDDTEMLLNHGSITPIMPCMRPRKRAKTTMCSGRTKRLLMIELIID
jgi:diguanylate cyclase (GGDEF)-like protein/PAS domain S-box-containing protein